MIMNETFFLLASEKPKNRKFGVDKVIHPLAGHFDTNSLSAWLSFNYTVHVKGAPEKTEKAKRADWKSLFLFLKWKWGMTRLIIGHPQSQSNFKRIGANNLR